MNLLNLDKIRIDGGTQPRCEIDSDLVGEYADAMRQDAEFPPVVVFHDGAEHWLADGFHRYHAARRAELTSLPADIRSGELRDAILYSVGANAAHGKRRTNADKRRAVLTLLEDEEWRNKYGNVEMAKLCAVSESFVRSLRTKRSEELGEEQPTQRTYTTRHGTVTTMDTTNIGRAKAQPGQDDEGVGSTSRDSPSGDPGSAPRLRRFKTSDLTHVRESVDAIFHLSQEPYSRLPYADLKQQVADLREYLARFADQ